jgi:hypothetical protein
MTAYFTHESFILIEKKDDKQLYSTYRTTKNLHNYIPNPVYRALFIKVEIGLSDGHCPHIFQSLQLYTQDML